MTGTIDTQTMASLAEALAYVPRNHELFQQALTHGSHSANDYDRLEFLGDRVLGLIISEALYDRFPIDEEGKLSHRLNALVAREQCAEIARSIGLPPLIRLGKQARDDGGRDSDNILGDVMEALIGAIYLESGIDEARNLILRTWGDRIDGDGNAPRHPKSALQEWAAAHNRKPPEYVVVNRDGPGHAPRFTVEVRIGSLEPAIGIGGSKQDAQKAAAEAMLKTLEQS